MMQTLISMSHEASWVANARRQSAIKRVGAELQVSDFRNGNRYKCVSLQARTRLQKLENPAVVLGGQLHDSRGMQSLGVLLSVFVCLSLYPCVEGSLCLQFMMLQIQWDSPRVMKQPCHEATAPMQLLEA